MPAEIRQEMSPDWFDKVESATTDGPWILGFRIVRIDDEQTLGQAGFKAPPESQGVVEIAYGIEPEFEGNGYATESANALVEFASGKSG